MVHKRMQSRLRIVHTHTHTHIHVAATESLNDKLGLYSLVHCFLSKYLLLNIFLIFAFQQNIMTVVILTIARKGFP